MPRNRTIATKTAQPRIPQAKAFATLWTQASGISNPPDSMGEPMRITSHEVICKPGAVGAKQRSTEDRALGSLVGPERSPRCCGGATGEEAVPQPWGAADPWTR